MKKCDYCWKFFESDIPKNHICHVKLNENLKWIARTYARKHIATAEDWYPTTNGLVKISLIKFNDDTWRVCVWGDDDYGLELNDLAEDKARIIFNQIVHLTTKLDLINMGFKNA